MRVQKHFDIQHHNTFRVSAHVRYFVEAEKEEDVPAALEMAEHLGYPIMVLGGGSNMLICSDLNRVVIHPNLQGIKEEHHGSEVVVEAGAGVNWHQLVRYTVERGYGGLENLALIPGTVGASPVQNIGAYGVELKDVFVDLLGFHRDHGRMVMDAGACRFAYRDSVFKGDFKDAFVVCSVRLRLQKQAKLNLSYDALQREIQKRGLEPKSPAELADLVAEIRGSKLPDPELIGNAGSFFKNPILSAGQYNALKAEFPDMPGFPTASEQVKSSAAWLIEQCGWKGARRGDAGVYDKHALVLVNHGRASGADLWSLATEIRQSVFERFNIMIEPEVNVLRDA
ncbi:MAG: UDP-N-acetylmuramate dehydrogenase [Bacteroidetes bacterium]|nr:UDP-N-acetylmuramate dehydrogenase [Bacteroidota bacterium]